MCLSKAVPRSIFQVIHLPIWQRDVDSLLKPAQEGRVQFPWTIRGTQEEDLIRTTRVICPFHLFKQFRLHTPCMFLLAGTALAADTVYLVNEDNGASRLSCGMLEQLFNQPNIQHQQNQYILQGLEKLNLGQKSNHHQKGLQVFQRLSFGVFQVLR